MAAMNRHAGHTRRGQSPPFVYAVGWQKGLFCWPKCVMYLSQRIRTYLVLGLSRPLENLAQKRKNRHLTSSQVKD